jgi:hypothetical protein
MSAFAFEDAVIITPTPPMRADRTASGHVPVARLRRVCRLHHRGDACLRSSRHRCAVALAIVTRNPDRDAPHCPELTPPV